MTRQLFAPYFGADPDRRWARMTQVLRYSAQQQCPGWTITIEHSAPPARTSAMRRPSHVWNTQKMDEWRRIVMAAAEGDELALLDGDTMVLRPLDPVWNLPFDMAYTTKDARLPFNSGVVFVRISERVKAFVNAWHHEQLRMLGDAVYHAPFRSRFMGINQAALGSMLERRHAFGINLLELPCLEWNCEDSSWPSFDPNLTRIVHVKSALRRAVFERVQVSQVLKPLVERWRSIEASATQGVSTDIAGAPGDLRHERVNGAAAFPSLADPSIGPAIPTGG